MSDQKNSNNTHSATSSPESADGATPCDSQAGQTTDHAGQEAHLANHSATQESRKHKQTPGTSGRCSSISLESAILQTSLENRLKQRLEPAGSMIYRMTWKQKVTPRGRSYYQLVASAATTSGKESGLLPNGWPTPSQTDHKGGYSGGRIRNGVLSTDRLDVTAQLAHFADMNLTSNYSANMVALTAKVTGWPTPQTMDTLPPMDYEKRLNHPSRPGRKTSGNLREVVTIAGWPSPTTTDAARGNGTIRPHDTGIPLPQRVAMIDRNQPMRLTACGKILTGSSAGMESGGQLNPAHSRWLMGYPAEWDYCGAMAMQSCHKSRRK